MASSEAMLTTSLDDIVASSKKRQAQLKKAAKPAPRTSVKNKAGDKITTAAQSVSAKAKKKRAAAADKRRGSNTHGASTGGKTKGGVEHAWDPFSKKGGKKAPAKKGKPTDAATRAISRGKKAEARAAKAKVAGKPLGGGKGKKGGSTPSKGGKGGPKTPSGKGAKGLGLKVKTPKNVGKGKRAAAPKSIVAAAASGGGVFAAASLGRAAANIRISIGAGGGASRGPAVVGLKQAGRIRKAVQQNQRFTARVAGGRAAAQQARRQRGGGIVKPGRDAPAAGMGGGRARGRQGLVQPAIRKL